MTAYGQDTLKSLTREEINLDNQAYYDAITYRQISVGLESVLDSAHALVLEQQVAIQQGQKTIAAKEETAAFYKSQAEMRAKENYSLDRNNRFWRMYAGLSTAAALVFGLILLK